jgi:hypothetical protein
LKGILRKIFWPMQCKEGQRIRSNRQLQELIKGKDIVNYIKAQKMKLGDILREWKI